jgi:hypothetical protein
VNHLVQAFLRGISTQQVGQVLAPVLGECYSALTISNITRELHHAIAQYHRLPLQDHYVYLFLDGVVLKVREVAGKVRRRPVLVAYGVLPTAAARSSIISSPRKRNRLAGISAKSRSAWPGRRGPETNHHRRRHWPARGTAGGLSAHPAELC